MAAKVGTKSKNIRERVIASAGCFIFLLSSCSFADEAWDKGSCRKKDMDFPVIDFHAHTFNFRHLPLRGILYGWGVPDFVAGVAADIIWGMTGSIDQVGPDQFSSLHFSADDRSLSAEFRTRALSPAIDYFAAPSDALSTPEQQRFENEMNEYLVDELEYERSLTTALGTDASAPLTDYFRGLAVQDPTGSLTDIGALAPDGRTAMLGAMAELSLIDRLVALLVRPFEIVGSAQGAYRFFSTMVQAEDKVAERLYEDNCMVDYFVHHMMDLEHVYNNRPPVSFFDQHDIVRRVRESSGDRLISFSAFVPFRYDDYNLSILKAAIESGFVGAKYYPPSGYGATVEQIPDKPKRFRKFIYQGGARKQWKHRYDPLSSDRVRKNWGVTITDKKKAREQTLVGVSDKFFSFAADRNLLIFAHQSPGGFEGYKGYGSVFAEPCAWLPVLKENPKQLLVLGHSGGYAWYADDAGFDNSFALQAFNMCVTYENVYCDFGYHEEILTDDGKIALRGRFQSMHKSQLVSTPAELTPSLCRSGMAPMKHSIFDKIMYGSDWMMIVKERNYTQLVEAFDAVFTGDLVQYKEKFFGGNALRILRKSGSADRLPEALRP